MATHSSLRSALTRDGALEDADVYALHELARAAGAPLARVRELLDEGRIATIDGEFIAHGEAVRVGRALKAGEPLSPPQIGSAFVSRASALFATRLPMRRAPGLPVVVSAAVHGLVALLLVVLAMPRVGGEEVTDVLHVRPEPVRLVYLSLPGPGGGGGGGGTREPQPAPRAKRKGSSVLSSPMPEKEPPPPVKPPPEPPPPPAGHLEALRAPIVARRAETEERTGVLEPRPTEEESRGAGEDEGAGEGVGVGRGDGEGPGVGEGSGGGAGGGPYRPGSGVEPPVIVQEVKAAYTEEARRRNIIGEVLLEVVVLRDGTVGEVRMLRGLGYGLDDQAVRAVKQWRFRPATLREVPVDVLVEVAVEFNMR
ncbi:MAG: energy transducer TonB [Vicinamibacteraceae bacterium]